MHYDLSVPWPLQPPAAQSTSKKGKQKAVEAPALRIEDRHLLEKTVEMAAHLGYGCVAYDLRLPPNTFDPATLRAYHPCPDGVPLLRDRDPRFGKRGAEGDVLQLSRLTVVLDETCVGGQGNGRCFVGGNASLLADFDLLAVEPTDAASFAHACHSLAAPTPTGIDIITLDLATSPKLPFQLKLSAVKHAVAQGVVFEVAYGVAMRSSAASVAVPKDARRNVLAGARELIRVSGGKGVILSGAVAHCMELRAPLDLVNLGGLLGFRPDQARAALSANCRAVVMRSHSSRQAYRGAVSKPVLLQDTPEGAKRKAAVLEAEQEEARKRRHLPFIVDAPTLPTET